MRTKYFYKYKLTCNHEKLTLEKKFKSMKELIDELKDPIGLCSRQTIYNIINKNGTNKKFKGVDIEKIREPIPIEKKIIITYL
jgi:hypothetical protein